MFLLMKLMRNRRTPQDNCCQSQHAQHVAAEDQNIYARPKRVEREAMKSVLLQHNRVVYRENPGKELEGRSVKGNWPKRATQEEKRDGRSYCERGHRLALLQQSAEQCSRGDEDGERQQREADHLAPV